MLFVLPEISVLILLYFSLLILFSFRFFNFLDFDFVRFLPFKIFLIFVPLKTVFQLAPFSLRLSDFASLDSSFEKSFVSPTVRIR